MWRLGLGGLLTAAGCYSGPTGQETDAEASTGGTAATGEGGPGGATGGSEASSGSEGGPGSGADSTGDDGSGSSDGGTTGGTGPDPAEVQMVCERWTSDRADTSEGTWSGSVAACDPGDVSADGRTNALRLLNLYRWMVELPEVTTDPARDAATQACALMMEANGALSHDPPMTWSCYTAEGAGAAGSSNISTGPGVMSVDLYMVDPGNPTTLGHRRWILSNGLGPVGLGSTSGSSCMWVIGGSGAGGNAWTAWPPPGPFPAEAVMPLGFSSLDETGWSIQSDSIDLGGAQVTITTAEGEPRPVTITPLAGGYGSSSAISMIPQGWGTEAGTSYHVVVEGVGMPIEYDVHVVECG